MIVYIMITLITDTDLGTNNVRCIYAKEFRQHWQQYFVNPEINPRLKEDSAMQRDTAIRTSAAAALPSPM